MLVIHNATLDTAMLGIHPSRPLHKSPCIQRPSQLKTALTARLKNQSTDFRLSFQRPRLGEQIETNTGVGDTLLIKCYDTLTQAMSGDLRNLLFGKKK